MLATGLVLLPLFMPVILVAIPLLSPTLSADGLAITSFDEADRAGSTVASRRSARRQMLDDSGLQTNVRSRMPTSITSKLPC